MEHKNVCLYEKIIDEKNIRGTLQACNIKDSMLQFMLLMKKDQEGPWSLVELGKDILGRKMHNMFIALQLFSYGDMKFIKKI